jgi:AcrR family transcriptional regulator
MVFNASEASDPILYNVKMPGRVRSVRSQTRRDAIIDFALKDISSVGVDGLSVTALIASAGITRPTFYSYFGDVQGLLAEIWLEKGRQWIDIVAAPGEFTQRDNELVFALTEIFISAHRSEELRTIVEISLAEFISEFSGDAGRLTAVMWRIANRVGVVGTQRVWPSVQDALFLDSFLDAVSTRKVKPNITVVDELPEIELDASEVVDVNIARGVIGIVGRGGVSGLSVLRLGRILRVTSGYLNPRIDSLKELVGLTYGLVQDSAARQNVKLWTLWNLNPRGFARFIVGSLGGSRQSWRLFRNEVLVASAHDPELAAIIGSTMDSLLKIVGSKVTGFGYSRAVTARISVLVHTMLFGFSTLSAVGVKVGELAHEGVIDALLKELAARRFRVS